MRPLHSIHSWLTDDRLAWQRRLAAYMMVVAGFALVLSLVQSNSRADREREAARNAAAELRDCQARYDSREVLRELVKLTGAAGPTDYSRFPSFARLDPETQAFLNEVAAASNARTGGQGFREQALAKIPLPDCEPLRRAAR